MEKSRLGNSESTSINPQRSHGCKSGANKGAKDLHVSNLNNGRLTQKSKGTRVFTK